MYEPLKIFHGLVILMPNMWHVTGVEGPNASAEMQSCGAEVGSRSGSGWKLSVQKEHVHQAMMTPSWAWPRFQETPALPYSPACSLQAQEAELSMVGRETLPNAGLDLCPLPGLTRWHRVLSSFYQNRMKDCWGAGLKVGSSQHCLPLSEAVSLNGNVWELAVTPHAWQDPSTQNSPQELPAGS